MSALTRASITGTVLAFACVVSLGLLPAQAAGQDKAAAPNRYIGAEKCKNCHQTEASGNQYGHWQKAGHSKAFEVLASDAAKAFAKERGIEDAQASEKCLKCHVTAFGAAPEAIKKGFDPKHGVQCESCHGPGEKHLKARFAAAAAIGADDSGARQELPAGEIISKVEMKTCLTCHNEESPTYKPFCFKERWAKIGHFDPRKPRPANYQVDCNCPKCEAEKKK
jgi:hypothetical protein